MENLARKSVTIDRFYGIDYTTDPSNVSMNQSPYAPNMIRDVPGKMRKCMGYYEVGRYDGSINGFHRLRGENAYLIHAGESIIRVEGDKSTVLFAQANNERSRSFQYSTIENGVPVQKLVIQDGKKLLVYDGETVVTAESVATIPTITIAKGSENAASYDPVNLLQPKYRESFYAEDVTVFGMSLTPLDDGSPVVVEWLNNSGAWEDISGEIASIDYESGTITLNAAKPVVVTGEDNIRITAQKTVEGYADRINKCNIGILYGVNGASDRLFVSGNPDTNYLNYDFYSGMNDPTYWPDIGYSTLGSPASAVMGYSIINNYLAAHKDGLDADRSVIIRSGTLVEGDAAFPIVNSLQGPGAIAKWSFANLGIEPLFVTDSGVYAITTSDVSGERYSQHRSYYCDGALLKEDELKDGYACVYNDMYWYCVGGRAYLLDGTQALSTNKDPYSTRQYACFDRRNIPARVMWVDSGKLYFGSSGGVVFCFYQDKDEQNSYTDNGVPIKASYETPDISGQSFYRNKYIRYLALQVGNFGRTVVELLAQYNGAWHEIKSLRNEAITFNFAGVDFSAFAFLSDPTAKTLHTRLRINKVDKVKFRIDNTGDREPFALSQVAVEYMENSMYRR